jgi:CRISPR-associated exonuclease Cas4
MIPSGPPLFSVGELKQFLYCPRIFFYSTVQPFSPPATHLMQRGLAVQQSFERLEPRRALSRFGFSDARRHFRVTMKDHALGLVGVADLLLEADNCMAVVDVKASAAPLALNHRLQLAAYALLAESTFLKPCPLGFAFFTDRESVSQIESIPLDSPLTQEVIRALQDMRLLFALGDVPDPTPFRSRCHGCEFRNFCGDVF